MQKNFVHWMFAAILVCGASVFTSCSSNDDNPTQPDLNVAEKIIGKWMVEELDGQACPTNLKAVITFLSPTKAYGSLSDYYSESWNNHTSADVIINGNDVTLTAFENEHIKHVTVANISSITANDMMLKSDWKVFVDGDLVINEVYDKERYITAPTYIIARRTTSGRLVTMSWRTISLMAFCSAPVGRRPSTAMNCANGGQILSRSALPLAPARTFCCSGTYKES